MMLAAAPRIARLLPLLGSPVDGEALGAARAIGRALKASGSDWHDLAAELLHPAPGAIPHHAQRPRRERASRASRTPPLPVETLRLLRAALRLDIFTTWEATFAASIIDAAQHSTWRPSPKQSEILTRLTGKAQEAEAHP